MNIENRNGYTLQDLNLVNIIMGKNGCGKSSLLKQIQQSIEGDEEFGHSKYITPERAGTLNHDPHTEHSVNSNQRWLPGQLRRNQFGKFKEQSVLQFRKLELLSLREIESDSAIRNNHDYTFQTIVSKINSLLDNIEIRREGSDFSIYRIGGDSKINAIDISSGESELISLGIEFLVFSKETQKDKENILFLDEPDAHLHPDLQQRLAIFLKGLVSESNFRVILATHSTSFLAAFDTHEGVSVSFMTAAQNELKFEKISNAYRKILPIFGAHPLSNIFNEAPVFLLEGEDDVRIWQQAVRSAQGRLKLYPCSTGSIDKMNEYEMKARQVLEAVYDDARAFSLRDRDVTEQEEIEDLPPVVRMRLSCRAAENLILSDEVLAKLGTDWTTVVGKIELWLEHNPDHLHFEPMQSFKNNSYDRKHADLKDIRNDLMGIIESNKPWEIVVGQTIAHISCVDKPADHSLQDYLGVKLTDNVIRPMTID